MSIADYSLIILISMGVLAAIFSLYRQKKSGKCIGCGGGCSSCNFKCADKQVQESRNS